MQLRSLLNKNYALGVGFLLFIFLGAGCASSDEKEMLSMFTQAWEKNFAKQGCLTLSDVKKMNGVKREDMGQRTYEVEYEGVVTAVQDCFWNGGYPLTAMRTKGLLGNKPPTLQTGRRFHALFKCTFEETDNGWRLRETLNPGDVLEI